MKQTRVAVDVVAGVLPGTPIPEHTKTFTISSEDWNAEGADQAGLLAEMNGKAMGWAGYLMMQPDAFNWVKTEWVWF